MLQTGFEPEIPVFEDIFDHRCATWIMSQSSRWQKLIWDISLHYHNQTGSKFYVALHPHIWKMSDHNSLI